MARGCHGEHRSRRPVWSRALALAAAAWCGAAPAQTRTVPESAAFPQRPLRVVVPVAAGGGHDLTVRILSSRLGEALGQQIVIDNRPGGGGSTGAALVARAAPDGYTLLAGSISTHALNPALHATLPYDPHRDFAPVSLIGTVPTVIESGVPGFEVGIWFAMFAPAATPSAVVARLHEAMVRALSAADLRDRMTQNGVDTRHSTPQELAVFSRAELARWAKVVKASGMTID